MTARLSLLFLTSAVLAGCSSYNINTAHYDKQCVFPDSPETQAPGWVCEQPVEDYPVTAVGSAEPSVAGLEFMRDQAMAVARVHLAEQMQVHVTGMVKRYVETTGSGDQETVDQVRSSVSRVVTEETVLGSKTIGRITSPKGYLYMLMGVDEENAAYNTQRALLTSMNNNQALWQKLQADKNFEELADSIAHP